MKKCVAVVICDANGGTISHSGRFVVAWNPHTKAGRLEVVSTDDMGQARRFEYRELMDEWRTVSRVESVRPWDGRPNRPLTAITINVVAVEETSHA
jgi:hypothetical protein